MGIDVYADWDGRTKEEQEAQYTGFSVTSGDAGYLREAYHGEPYATMVLFPECFHGSGREDPDHRSDAVFVRHYLDLEDEDDFTTKYFLKEFGDQSIERNRPSHQEWRKWIDEWNGSGEAGIDHEGRYWYEEFAGNRIPAATLEERLPAALEAAAERNRALYKGDMQDEVLQSFRDFVALYRRLEDEGRNPRVYVSY